MCIYIYIHIHPNHLTHIGFPLNLRGKVVGGCLTAQAQGIAQVLAKPWGYTQMRNMVLQHQIFGSVM